MTTSNDWDAILDDANEWEVPEPAPRRKSERRRRGAVVSVRFSPEELAEVQARASANGIGVSSYLRECALVSASTPTRGAVMPMGAIFSVTMPQSPVRFTLPSGVERFRSASAVPMG